jgi:hypothetical protein
MEVIANTDKIILLKSSLKFPNVFGLKDSPAES